MAATCKNCARPVRFDPATQKVVCDFCGGSFVPEEIEEYGKDVLAKVVPEAIPDEYIDSYVYCCSSCGGQIIVNGTESSTSCVYCGSPSIVFSRIIKQKRPENIIPFKITKEEALKAVKKELQGGIFIPRKIKRFKQDAVRGIYIPYWIFDADHFGAVSIEGSEQHGRNSQTIYHARAGYMKLHRLPIDASSVLSNESSERLEPFNMSEMKPFNESYLLGFYSDISDVKYEAVTDLVRKRAKRIFEDYAKSDVVSDKDPIVTFSYHDTEIFDEDVGYAMLPAWFITYRYRGQNNTILVNGQTGKVVCGVPWNRKLVMALYVILCVLLTFLAFYLIREVLNQTAVEAAKDNDPRSFWGALVAIIGVGCISFKIGYKHIKKLFKSVDLTQKSSLFNYMKRRQG